jgi:hypothetical protein
MKGPSPYWNYLIGFQYFKLVRGSLLVKGGSRFDRSRGPHQIDFPQSMVELSTYVSEIQI